MPERMQMARLGFGLTQFANDAVALAGGTRSDKRGTPGTDRLRYVVYDMAAIRGGATPTAAELGSVEINVRHDEDDIEGLVSIAVAPTLRGRGHGRRIVEAIAATSREGLRVYDIQPSAARFWRRVGCLPLPGRAKNGVFPAPEPAAEPERTLAPAM